MKIRIGRLNSERRKPVQVSSNPFRGLMTDRNTCDKFSQRNRYWGRLEVMEYDCDGIKKGRSSLEQKE